MTDDPGRAQRDLLGALVRHDPAIERRYHESATFHAIVDTIVNLLPRFLRFAAVDTDRADAEHERLAHHLRTAPPMSVRLTKEQAAELGLDVADDRSGGA